MTEEESRPLWMKESRRLIDELKPLLEKAKGLLSDLENQNQLLGRPDWWRQKQKTQGEAVRYAVYGIEEAARIVEDHDLALEEHEKSCPSTMNRSGIQHCCRLSVGHDGDHESWSGWQWDNKNAGVKP